MNPDYDESDKKIKLWWVGFVTQSPLIISNTWLEKEKIRLILIRKPWKRYFETPSLYRLCSFVGSYKYCKKDL